MPLHWHVNLPGPVAYSRPIRRKGKKPGLLTSVLVWFIVKPLELMFRGLAALFRAKKSATPVAARTSSWPMLGWYNTTWGPLYWSGENWYTPDGESIF